MAEPSGDRYARTAEGGNQAAPLRFATDAARFTNGMAAGRSGMGLVHRATVMGTPEEVMEAGLLSGLR